MTPDAATPARPPQWMHYGDVVRILGTVAVVVGHVSDMVVFGHSDRCTPGSPNWWVANGWDSVARWAVPIYIMLSGSLLLDPGRAESPATFYRKRLARLGVPLVFWSLFFMWLDVYYTQWRATIDPAFETVGPDYKLHYLWSAHSPWQWVVYLLFSRPQKSWMLLLAGQPYMHMHFIFRIAGLYAFTPMLRVFLNHAPRPMVVTTVALLLAVSSADSVANNVTGTSLSAFGRFAPFVGYYLAGYLLRTPVESGRTIALCWAGFFASVVALAAGTGLLVHHYVTAAGLTQIKGPPSMEMMLYDFLSPVRVVMALCAWVVLVRLFREPWPYSHRGRSVVRYLANTTLGLYLIHPLFREIIHVGGTPALDWIQNVTPVGLFHTGGFQFFWRGAEWFRHAEFFGRQIGQGIDATWPNIWIGVPLLSAMVYIPSLLTTMVLMKIPYVRRIAG